MNPVAGPRSLRFGPFELDGEFGRLSREGLPVELAPRPLALLEHLARHPGELITKDALLDAVWGHRHVSESALKGAVNTLRQALGDEVQAPQWIETVPRRGYRFIGTVRMPEAAPRRGELPRLAAPLIGRDAEVQAVGALLASQRLVTLAGTGGVGKTHLALAVAAGLAAPSEGIWFVALDGLRDGQALVATIARALRLAADAARSAETLAAALAPQSLLLVLDNCEHLLDEVAPLVGLLLAQAGDLRVLATSQEPLHLAGERVVRVAPLPCPPGEEQVDIERYAAVALFVRRVRALDDGFVVDDDNRALVAALCSALDGLPLALELAAARVPLLGVAGVHARLSERLALLTRGARDAPARQRTLLATLEWSHALLSPAQAVVLRRLSVFAGGFSLAAAQEVVADRDLAEWEVLEAIGALQDKSLLVAAPGPGPRWRLFDSVRGFAAEHLEAAGETATLRRRHLGWMRAALADAAGRAHAEPTLAWTAALLPETDNLRAALQHALAAGSDDSAAVALVAHAAVFWQRAGLKHEALRWFDAVADRVARAPGPVRADWLQGKALLSVFAMAGAAAEAEAGIDEAVRLHRAGGDALAEYIDLYLKARLVERVRYGEDSAPLLQRMLAIERPGWGVLMRRLARWVRGLRLREMGDIHGYRRFCLEEVAHHRAAGDSHGAWTASHGVALAEHDLGDTAAATATLGGVLDEVRAQGLLRQYPVMVGLHACLLLEAGDPAQWPRVREAVQLLRVDGTLWCMAGALPFAALSRGDAEAAARVLGWADATVAALGESPGPLFARLRSGCEQRLQQALEPTRLQALREEGATLAEAQALRQALGEPG